MTQILIAHQNPDLAEDLRTTLRERFETEPMPWPVFTFERNGANALTALAQELPRLVIVELDLPTDRRSGPVALGGLHFAEAVRARHPGLQLIFIAPFTLPELSIKVDALGRAALVVQGNTFASDLTARVLEAWRDETAPMAADGHPSLHLAPRR